MENKMTMTITWSKLKPEVELQNDGRLFSQNGSSLNSAVDRVVVTQFGTLRDPIPIS